MRGSKSSSSSSTQNNNSSNYSVMNRVMLRFRPIAPKPPGGDQNSDAADLAKRNGSVKRTKRKYVRVRCRQTKRPEKPCFVTLQLLPERSESDQICPAVEENLQLENNNNNNNVFRVDEEQGNNYMEEVSKTSFRSVVDTWIIVESITETNDNNNGVGLGFTDKDRVSNLEADTCPGFVSDGGNKVVWVNEAYRRMAMVESDDGGVCVRLVVKDEKLPCYLCSSFACRVRILIQDGQKLNKIVPCDVWRMDFQGFFAWKLDVNTALSL